MNSRVVDGKRYDKTAAITWFGNLVASAIGWNLGFEELANPTGTRAALAFETVLAAVVIRHVLYPISRIFPHSKTNYTLYDEELTSPPLPVQFVWKNFPRG